MRSLTRRTFAFTAAATCILSVACTEAPTAVPYNAVDDVVQAEAPWTLDDEFARVARDEVPGFAGRYIDANAALVVAVTDRSSAIAAVKYGEAYRSRLHLGSSPVIVKIVEFDAMELLAWKNAASNELMDHAFVYSVDLDEAENRIAIGAAPPQLAYAEHLALELGIPAAALDVYEDGPADLRVSVTDRYRPVTPGFQVRIQGGGRCTIGMNGIQSSTGDPILITNSHCTANDWAYDGGLIFQNDTFPGNRVGVEVADRGAYECVPDESCRWSDAAFFAYDDSVSWHRYSAARTGSSLVMTSTWSVTGMLFSSDLSTGQGVRKQGIATGYSQGKITRSCITRQAGGVPITELRCQFEVASANADGDSGAPVLYGSALSGVVEFVGVLWGGRIADGIPYFFFSPSDGILADLGSFSL